MDLSISLLVPFGPLRPAQLRPLARVVRRTGARALWMGQTRTVDPVQALASLGAAGIPVAAGTCVTLMPYLHPFAAALQARSAALANGCPFVAGVGPGTPELQLSVRGAPYRSVLGAVREYVAIMRSVLDGSAPPGEGEYYSCGSPSPFPDGSPSVEIGLGVLRSRMAELAGGIADTAISWMAPAAYLGGSLIPALDTGATGAGRARPRVVAVVPTVPAGLGLDDVDVFLAGNGHHLRAGHYRDMLRRSGVAVGDDLGATARSAIDRGVVLHGEADRIRDGLAAYADAGVDEVVLGLFGVAAVAGAAAAVTAADTLLADLVEP